MACSLLLAGSALAAPSGPINSDTAFDSAIGNSSTTLNISGNITLNSSKTIGYAASLTGGSGTLYTLSGNNSFRLFSFADNAPASTTWLSLRATPLTPEERCR